MSGPDVRVNQESPRPVPEMTVHFGYLRAPSGAFERLRASSGASVLARAVCTYAATTASPGSAAPALHCGLVGDLRDPLEVYPVRPHRPAAAIRIGRPRAESVSSSSATLRGVQDVQDGRPARRPGPGQASPGVFRDARTPGRFETRFNCPQPRQCRVLGTLSALRPPCVRRSVFRAPGGSKGEAAKPSGKSGAARSAKRAACPACRVSRLGVSPMADALLGLANKAGKQDDYPVLHLASLRADPVFPRAGPAWPCPGGCLRWRTWPWAAGYAPARI